MTGFCPQIWSLRETAFGLISTSTPIIAPDIGMTRVAQKKNVCLPANEPDKCYTLVWA